MTLTMPVVASADSVPLNAEVVETLTLVVFAGVADGVTVVLPLRATLVFPYVPSVGG